MRLLYIRGRSKDNNARVSPLVTKKTRKRLDWSGSFLISPTEDATASPFPEAAARSRVYGSKSGSPLSTVLFCGQGFRPQLRYNTFTTIIRSRETDYRILDSIA